MLVLTAPSCVVVCVRGFGSCLLLVREAFASVKMLMLLLHLLFPRFPMCMCRVAAPVCDHPWQPLMYSNSRSQHGIPSLRGQGEHNTSIRQ